MSFNLVIYEDGRGHKVRPGRHRIIYSFYQRTNILLLHALLKKSDKLPQTDIDLALKRKEEFEERIGCGDIQI